MTRSSEIAELEERILASERLLGALIALLSARDPRLLEDLQAVFSSPDFASDKAGRAASQTWRRVHSDLKDMSRLVKGVGPSSSD